MVIDSIQVSPLHLPFQVWPMVMAPVYGGGGSLAPQAMVAPVQTTALIEQQAINSLLQDMTAGPIRKLHDYLDAHSQKHNQLIHCVPVVQQAARAFGAHDYTQALAQICQAYRYISALRASVPDLPSV